MSTLVTDTISPDPNLDPLSLDQLRRRIIRETRSTYTGGGWRGNNTFQWVPGAYVDYTPLSASSRIRCYWTLPTASWVGNAQAISHWIFYSNGSTEQGRHNMSCNHKEHRATYVWDFASWGTSVGRIGYQMRMYTLNNHEMGVYSTRYWEGNGSNQNCYGQTYIQEYLAT